MTSGARVFVAGRSQAKLEPVVADIVGEGGLAEAAVLDVLDTAAVDQHVAAVTESAGSIDVFFNAVTFGDIQGAQLVDMEVEHITSPVVTALQAHVVSVRAIARRMIGRGSGVIMTVTGYGQPFPELGSTGIAWSTVEALYRQFACELGPQGIRVVWLRTGGFRESILGQEAYQSIHMYTDDGLMTLSDLAADAPVEDELKGIRDGTLLKRLPTLAEAGATAAFLASSHAASVTATGINLTSGAVVD